VRSTGRLSANERRKFIIEKLSAQRSVTVRELQDELGVNERTIRRDITELSAEYPVYTKQGGAGGIYVQDGWYLSSRHLSGIQASALQKVIGMPEEVLGKYLSLEEMKSLRSIYQSFSVSKKSEKSFLNRTLDVRFD